MRRLLFHPINPPDRHVPVPFTLIIVILTGNVKSIYAPPPLSVSVSGYNITIEIHYTQRSEEKNWQKKQCSEKHKAVAHRHVHNNNYYLFHRQTIVQIHNESIFTNCLALWFDALPKGADVL